ncbi:hypothetical protein B0J14DRAFT_678109 [Halenospora varia]|nr:hypothetical protein B0J14DRAFT_678109 [Halenospora varia]
MINSIHDGAIVLKPRELQEPYNRATVRAAHSFYVKQFDRYTRTKDLRKTTREMMPCGDYRKSGLWDHCFLSMKFADIDLDFLSGDVLGQVQRDFEEMVFTDFNVNSKRNQVGTVAMGVLFNTKNQSLKRTQLMLGKYLRASGTRPGALASLSTCGLCSGPSALDNVFKKLAKEQENVLQSTGKPVPVDLRLIYDDFLVSRTVLSSTVGVLRNNCLQNYGESSTGFMPFSMGGVVGVEGVALPLVVDNQSQAIIVAEDQNVIGSYASMPL